MRVPPYLGESDAGVVVGCVEVMVGGAVVVVGAAVVVVVVEGLLHEARTSAETIRTVAKNQGAFFCIQTPFSVSHATLFAKPSSGSHDST